MLRNIVLAVAGIAAAITLAPTAQAAPKFCDAHGGNVYIHACAVGGGGTGNAAREAGRRAWERMGLTEADFDRHPAAHSTP